MIRSIFRFTLFVVTVLATSASSEETSESESIWFKAFQGTNTMWQKTKDGSVVVWQKTKASTENICDYRPSNLIGSAGSGALATAGASTAAVGLGVKAAGFYTLTHAVTGATMLGSTAGGASAAGTVGIMGGTAGAIGTIGSIVMAPATIIAGVVIGGGTALLEGGCYFSVDRLDDPKLIMDVLESISANSDRDYFNLTKDTDGEAIIYLATEVAENGIVLKREKYEVSKLYIEGGVLRHVDWGPNSQIGQVGYILGQVSDN